MGKINILNNVDYLWLTKINMIGLMNSNYFLLSTTIFYIVLLFIIVTITFLKIKKSLHKYAVIIVCNLFIYCDMVQKYPFYSR